MNYGFLIGVIVLGLLVGAIGLIAALRERRERRGRMRQAWSARTNVVEAFHERFEAMIRVSREKREFPVNQVAVPREAPPELQSVYAQLWKRRHATQSQLKS